MIVEFHKHHNHALDAPATLAKRDVSGATRASLLELFGAGYGAAEALAVLRHTTLEGCSPAELGHDISDRSVVPDLAYVDRSVTQRSDVLN